MANNKKKKFVIDRFAATGGNSYRGALYLLAPGVYSLEVCKIAEELVEKETTSFHKIRVKEERLRPAGNIAADKKAALQEQIDAYLKKSKKTIEELLLEGEKKDGDKVKKGRLIELELGFKVQFYLHEGEQLKEVPLISTQSETTHENIGNIPFYFKPMGSQVRKAIINYVNHKK